MIILVHWHVVSSHIAKYFLIYDVSNKYATTCQKKKSTKTIDIYKR